MSITRRLFLRNTAAGALASTAVAVPVIAEATQRDSAFARARYHYDQFAAAMDELTVGYHGWLIRGAGHRREFSAPGCRTLDEGAWFSPAVVEYQTGTEPRCPSLVIEWHHEIIGLQKQSDGWRDEPMNPDGRTVRL
ncbi:hypothetical protein [Mesorhizobium sp. M4B.F.Ca.ET.017.02.2.1]|uniref:hypothetical protein n=1 Tax=Mesorhizobium sp. M4B.F.Ca.ET.017.02.2.1 TaxID=2496649 RepID=UPI000FCB2C9C|nr:hypothetical protein [Mesorhizobium sp. M4B.F.Ca.ET.017.02.2.1]RVD31406.1 hypothetical protein EN738_01760 [Mesorhizobium sp. M4B.F.Ca.ET.017.02.2.1]